MKLAQARECYYSHSGSASAAARQIAFAGIAVVWVFNQPQASRVVVLPDPLVVVLLLLCCTLAFDLLQYTLSTAAWGIYSRHKEVQLRHRFHENPDIEPPRELNWPGLAMFWLKLACLVAAFGTLAWFLVEALALTGKA